jgi:hypothetical protein
MRYVLRVPQHAPHTFMRRKLNLKQAVAEELVGNAPPLRQMLCTVRMTNLVLYSMVLNTLMVGRPGFVRDHHLTLGPSAATPIVASSRLSP